MKGWLDEQETRAEALRKFYEREEERPPYKPPRLALILGASLALATAGILFVWLWFAQ